MSPVLLGNGLAALHPQPNAMQSVDQTETTHLNATAMRQTGVMNLKAAGIGALHPLHVTDTTQTTAAGMLTELMSVMTERLRGTIQTERKSQTEGKPQEQMSIEADMMTGAVNPLAEISQ